MTDRINAGRPVPMSAAAGKGLAPAGLALASSPASIATDATSVHATTAQLAAAAGRASESVATAPTEPESNAGHGLLDFGHRLLNTFVDIATFTPRLLRKALAEPLSQITWGMGQKLDVGGTHEFPRALAASWRGQAEPPRLDAPTMAALQGRILAALGGSTQPSPALGASLDARAQAIATQIRAALGPDADAQLQDPAVRATVAKRATEVVAQLHLPAEHPTQLDAVAIGAATAMADAVQVGLAERIAAYAALDPETRKRYAALMALFSDSPRVQGGLEALLGSGKLAATDPVTQHSVLDHLEALAQAPMAPGVEAHRTDLLGETILEIAEPGSIAQRGRNSCGATSAQATLALTDPAEYVRLVAGLASPAGTVKTRTGVLLTRDEHWDAEDKSSSQGVPRTTSSRLLQPAIMDVGAINDYDNDTDEDRLWVARMGTKPAGVERQLEALTGKNWDWTSTNSAIGRNQVNDRLKHASNDHPVVVAMNYNVKGEVAPVFHWVRVVGYDAAQDEVVIRNTQRGTEEHIDRGEFRERMFFAVHERAD